MIATQTTVEKSLSWFRALVVASQWKCLQTVEKRRSIRLIGRTDSMIEGYSADVRGR